MVQRGIKPVKVLMVRQRVMILAFPLSCWQPGIELPQLKMMVTVLSWNTSGSTSGIGDLEQ
jgi:hypothetical protein